MTAAADERRLGVLADVNRVFDAFAGGDPRALFEVIAEDAVWRVAGSVPVARDYRGREEIFELFRATRRLTGGTYRSRLHTVFADDDWAVAIYRATGSRNGIDLDVEQALVIRIADGLWQEVTAVPLDSAFERFWAP